jgi:hypothetical protein
MPVYTIEAPDGRKIKIEADTPDMAMKGAQEWASANPKGSGKSVEDLQKDLSAGKTRFSQLPKSEQEAIARAERGTVDSTVRGLSRGLPFIGTFGDEINSRINAAAGGYLGGSQAGSYDERVEDNLAYERAKDSTFDSDHPIASTGLQVAGGIGGTLAVLPAVAGAGAVGATGRTLLGVGSKTLPGAVARGMAAGAAQGAAAGVGDAEGGFVDRAMGGLQGGAIGTIAGGAIPLGFEFARRGGAALYNKAVGQSDALSGLTGAARRYVGEISSPEQVAHMRREFDRLGPLAMPADVSPEWQMVASGAAARPGSRQTVVSPLEARNAQSNTRLRADLDTHLGPTPTPSWIEEGLDASRNGPQGLGPNEYREVFRGAGPVDTSGLAESLDEAINLTRGESQRAIRNVRSWLNSPQAAGAGEEGAAQLERNPAVLHQIRMEIDGLLTDETNPRVIARLTEARQEVDTILANSVDGIKDVDAQFAELSRQSEALRRGPNVLDVGKTAIRPEELAREVQEGALPQGTLVGPSAAPHRLRQGLRANIDRVVGTNGNDALAIRREMRGTDADGDWNPQKLGTVFGEDRARGALNSVDREVRFQNTANQVVGGSKTAPTKNFQEALDRAENPGTGMMGGSGGDLTAFGALVKGARGVGAILMGEIGKAKANRFATELARISIAQGVGRDEFVAALQRAGVKQQRISKALDYATRSGLIIAREGPQLLPERQSQGSR